jgi:hypothetical protein
MVIHNGKQHLTAEEKRLKEDKNKTKYWKRWGPYLSERQWVSLRGFLFADSIANTFLLGHCERRLFSEW